MPRLQNKDGIIIINYNRRTTFSKQRDIHQGWSWTSVSLIKLIINLTNCHGPQRLQSACASTPSLSTVSSFGTLASLRVARKDWSDCPDAQADQTSLYEPQPKSTKSCAPRENSDQPGPKVSSCRQRRLIRLGGCPGWFESSLGAQVILLVFSWRGSYIHVSEPFVLLQLNWLLHVSQREKQKLTEWEWNSDMNTCACCCVQTAKESRYVSRQNSKR